MKGTAPVGPIRIPQPLQESFKEVAQTLHTTQTGALAGMIKFFVELNDPRIQAYIVTGQAKLAIEEICKRETELRGVIVDTPDKPKKTRRSGDDHKS